MPEGAKLEDSEIIGPWQSISGKKEQKRYFTEHLRRDSYVKMMKPIPSMWNWLKEDYPPEKVHDNTEAQHRNVADDEGKEASSEGAIKREQDTNSGMDIEQ